MWNKTLPCHWIFIFELNYSNKKSSWSSTFYIEVTHSSKHKNWNENLFQFNFMKYWQFPYHKFPICLTIRSRFPKSTQMHQPIKIEIHIFLPHFSGVSHQWRWCLRKHRFEQVVPFDMALGPPSLLCESASNDVNTLDAPALGVLSVLQCGVEELRLSTTSSYPWEGMFPSLMSIVGTTNIQWWCILALDCHRTAITANHTSLWIRNSLEIPSLCHFFGIFADICSNL